MSIDLNPQYFRNYCLEVPAKLEAGTLSSYGGYHTLDHSVVVDLNGHIILMEYTLRFEIAKDKVLHAVPLAQIELTFTARPFKDYRGTSSIMTKVIEVKLNSETFEEQIDEAIQTLERVINDVKMPTIAFDFWKYVASAMPDFEKQVSRTCVNNYARLNLKD